MSSTNGWTRNVEQLLKNWSQQISINENQYRKRGTYYRNWYYAFAAFEIIVQTGALTSLINVIVSINADVDTDGSDCGISSANMGVLVFVAVIETLNLVAHGLDKFFNFGAGSEQYYDAAKEHNSLSRLIDSTLILPRADRDVARQVLLSIQEQFNQLQDNSPNLPPNVVIHRLDMCIYDDPTQACGNQGIRIGAAQGLLAMEEEAPPAQLPKRTKAVDLPGSPPGEVAHDPDEERVSNAQRHKFVAQLGEQKKKAIHEHHQKKGHLKNLEYQWRRMEQHGDEYSLASGDRSSSDYSPENMP